jgi:glycosyltransferase involved in cell wall biosynthesis
LEGKAVAAADGVSAPSASVLNETRKYYGLTLSEAKIIPNPIRCISDNERWSADMCEKNLILFVGRFDRHKGGDIVVRAFGKIASVNPRARLLFCGPDRGFIDNDGIKYSYNDFLDKINLPSTIRERIEFLGQQPSERIETFRRNASVTVVASRYENFGGVLLEAASLGCPVVATDCGGNPEIIKQGETGILVPPNDPNTMADAISVLLGDRVRAAQLGARLWKDVKKRFDPESIAERTMSFYREVISRWRG